MNKIGLLVLSNIAVVVLLVGVMFKAQSTQPVVTDEAKMVEDFNNRIEAYTDEMENTLGGETDPVIHNMSGTASNFEGPRLSIAFISHHGREWSREDEPYYIANSSYVDFDPDWESYGLPNLRVEVEQPKFVSLVENGVLDKNIDDVKKLLPAVSDISPVKSYTKTYRTSDGKYEKEKFDLYLTEFSVTVGVKPLRADSVLPLSNDEKKKNLYPRSWYQDKLLSGDGSMISLNDLRNKEEYKNQRYSRIHIAFKVEPNNTAWYVSGEGREQVAAQVAVGSIIPKSISSNIQGQARDGDKKYDIAHIDPGSPGVNVDMFPDSSFAGRFDGRKILTSEPSLLDESIFGKDVYFRVTSNNIGSWDNRWMFIGDEWDDQFVIKFFMPLLVKGKIEVALDSDLIPAYTPRDSYYQHFSLSDLIPDWGIPEFGKYVTYAILIFAGIIVLIFMPNVFVLINYLLGIVVRMVKPSRLPG